MADFYKAIDKVFKIEFNKPSNALHINKGEKGYTFMGIYQKYHPELNLWSKADKILHMGYSLEEASTILYNDLETKDEVLRTYKKEYWDVAKLDQVKSQKIAEEIFIFGINAHIKRAIRAAQELVGVTIDGIVGPKTLQAINNFDEKVFDKYYDTKEIQYYINLTKINPKRYKRYLNGWINRANFV